MREPIRAVLRLAPENANNPREVHLVPKGRLAFLWVGPKSGPCFGYFSGPEALRKFAKAILREIPAKTSRAGRGGRRGK